VKGGKRRRRRKSKSIQRKL